MSKAPRAQILITLSDEGMLEVTGSTENRLLFLGMMELAKDTVLNQPQREQQLVKPVIPNLVSLAKR